MDAMPFDIREKLFRLRCKSKQGMLLTEEETDFCRKCFSEYPVEYSEMSREVFEATKPFGSKG